MGKVFTMAEVSEHNNIKDCWLVIHGKVYDVTKFIDDHPGGDEVLVSATGRDATEDFEDVKHSESAKAVMEKYYIGDVNASTIPSKNQYTPPPGQLPSSIDEKFFVKLLQILVPLIILGVAVGIRFYTKSSA